MAVFRGPDIPWCASPRRAPRGHRGSLKRENRDPTCDSAGHHRCCSHGQGGGFLQGAGFRRPAPNLFGMSSLNEQKQALRAQLRARAPKSGSPAFVAASVRAQERLAAAALQSGARVIALYRALASECGTASVAAALEAAGREVCYPAVVPGALALQFRRSAGVFVAGALGVEEPTGGPVSLADIDLLVVSATPVGAAGGRARRGPGPHGAAP